MPLYNLAWMSTTTIGPGTLTLGSAVPSYLTFEQAGVQNGETVTYAIEDGNNREIGYGVYNAVSKTLTRNDVLKSTNNDNPINLSGSSRANVSITAAAEDIGPPGPKGDTGDPGEVEEAPTNGPFLRKNGIWIPMTYATIALTADRILGAINTIHDVLSVDVGNEGVWFVTAAVTAGWHGQAVAYIARIWDGTTIIADSTATATANWPTVLSLNGIITDPVGPIKLSCVGLSIASQAVRANAYNGNFASTTKQTQLTALRIG